MNYRNIMRFTKIPHDKCHKYCKEYFTTIFHKYYQIYKNFTSMSQFSQEFFAIITGITEISQNATQSSQVL